jgi:carboxymethylenebutenolidase
MIEKQVDVATNDGHMQTYICHPERGSSPVVLLFMDAYGIREELREMARRIATCGYYVFVPNLYYRMGLHELGPIPEPGDDRRINRLTTCVQSLSIPKVLEDAGSLLVFADIDDAATDGPVGCVGYCMSGRFAIAAAAEIPDRVKAAASIFGTWLISEDPLSPHRAACRAPGELYFACAEVDHWAPLEVVDELRKTVAGCRARAEIEIYPGVEHGFAFKGRASYDRVAEERHWERIFALFRRSLHRAI